MNFGTIVKVIDNSGAIFGKCIKLYKKGRASVGDIVMVSLKSVKTKRFVKRGQLFKGLVVRSRENFYFLGGHFGKCYSYAIVLLKKDTLDLVGTRINSPVSSQLKSKGFVKILSISKYVY